jgi:CRP/FNR family transcriptional regulator, cyclic AMP receptor protein
MKNLGSQLKKISLFKDLSSAELEQLARYCQLSKYDPYTSIVEQNSRSNNIYFIVAGKVKVSYQSHMGKEVMIFEHGRGDTIGALSLVETKFPLTRATTASPTSILSMDKEQFCHILKSLPAVSFRLNHYLLELLNTLTERIIEFTLLDVNTRIRAELLRLAKLANANSNIATISPIPTHYDIASRVSTHREAITRELKALESKGFIERKPRALTILDRAALAKMVENSLGNPC